MITYFHVSKEKFDSGYVITKGFWGKMVREVMRGVDQNCQECLENYNKNKSSFDYEQVFEHVRANEFPNKISRLDCCFVFDNLDSANWFNKEYRENNANIYEVELLNPSDILEMDFKVITDPISYSSHKEVYVNVDRNHIINKIIIEGARKYWSGYMDNKSVKEILVDGDIKLLSKVN